MNTFSLLIQFLLTIYLDCIRNIYWSIEFQAFQGRLEDVLFIDKKYLVKISLISEFFVSFV